ncbi:peptidogalycan biosysnthesis protein [Actinokineospora enzanensis]|uniref:peptidogalycan biosysnthesis protein n=1 Tax=Actinokineospora enzanensis TaxID=155975 RepID=UPI00036F1AC2|nr:peptidogalycan biosysnthesis protein [Actinokineospora enzanensis]
MKPFQDPVGGMSTVEWEALSADRLYSSYRWLDLTASSMAGAVHGRTPAGALAAMPISVADDGLGDFYRWSDQLAPRGLVAPPASGVLVGPRRGYQSHLLSSPGADPVAAAATVLDGLSSLDDVPDGAPRVGMYLDTASVVAFRSAGVRSLPVLLRADAWIPVPDGGWDDWLRSLPSRSRAELVRRERRKFEAVGYEVTDHPLSDWVDVVGQLLTNTEAKYGHSTDPAARRAFLGRQADCMGPAARVLLCARPGEPPVGYCLYYLWGDTLFLRSAGFDYSRLHNAAEYFNLVYYLPVRIAAEAGAHWIHAGVEAAEAKAMRGAQLRPLWLLELSDGVLSDQDDAIRAANTALVTELTGSSSAVRTAWCTTAADDFGITPTEPA